MINLVLLVGIVVAAQQLISAWKEFEAGQNVESVVERAKGVEGEQSVAALDIEPPEVLQHDFFVISERDLFSATRRPAPLADENAEEETPPEFPKKPEMTGAMNMNGAMSAFIVVFENPRSQGEDRTVRVGDDVQGWTVAEISDTVTTLQWNGHQEIIDMADASSRPQSPQRQASQAAAVNIVKIGSRYAAVETNEMAAPESNEGGPSTTNVAGGGPAAQTPITASGRIARPRSVGRRGGATQPTPAATRPTPRSPSGVAPQQQDR